MNKYPIVIYLDKNLTKEVSSLQQKLSKLTGTRACLDLWEPHLTIGSAVIEDNVELLAQDIQNAVKGIHPFKVQLKDFAYMNIWTGIKMAPSYILHSIRSLEFKDTLKRVTMSPYVVYIHVIKNNNLEELAKTIKTVTDKRKLAYRQPWPYTPHITIAFRDLTKEGFVQAKKLLATEKFSGELLIDHIAIVKENDNGTCTELQRIKLR